MANLAPGEALFKLIEGREWRGASVQEQRSFADKERALLMLIAGEPQAGLEPGRALFESEHPLRKGDFAKTAQWYRDVYAKREAEIVSSATEALRAENERLRALLQIALNDCGRGDCETCCKIRATLETGK